MEEGGLSTSPIPPPFRRPMFRMDRKHIFNVSQDLATKWLVEDQLPREYNRERWQIRGISRRLLISRNNSTMKLIKYSCFNSLVITYFFGCTYIHHYFYLSLTVSCSSARVERREEEAWQSGSPSTVALQLPSSATPLSRDIGAVSNRKSSRNRSYVDK